MAEIKHEDIVRAVRLAADIENAALTIAQQEILINRLSAELKEAQSIAEQMLDIVLEKQKAEKSKAEPEVRIASEAECVERFVNKVIEQIEICGEKMRILFVKDSFYEIYKNALTDCKRIVTGQAKEFLKEKTAVKE